MLGLKRAGRLGRRAGFWALPLTTAVLGACSSDVEHGAALTSFGEKGTAPLAGLTA